MLNNIDKVPYITFKSLENIPWLKCGFSTRLGGVSKGIFSTMNMSFTRGDVEADVRENIRLFSEAAGFNG
ncbi:MAG: laccase domain-containing protein, partial [Lachnospiraceae bacterium]|nr:laccase domain-containing protein [Lachnospiraceae bacterium]